VEIYAAGIIHNNFLSIRILFCNSHLPFSVLLRSRSV
jgi:hypothetical protein